MDDLADLLRKGVRVALMYGDADFICNWYGGQAVSLAVADLLPDYPASPTPLPASVPGPVTYASGFPAAGYAEIVTNETYVGGEVRQFGNLSFSRIYDAGHFVPYFQPNTAFEVFSRIIQGKDIATGQVIDLSSYSSTGPANSSHTNKAPPAAPSSTCWIRSWNSSCSASDNETMFAGNGIVANGIFYQDDSNVIVPSSSVAAGVPGRPMSTSSGGTATAPSTTSPLPLTGVYTATSTPSPTSATEKLTVPIGLLLSLAIGILC